MEEKAVFSHWFQREEKGQGERLFHTRVIVQDRACALTIDHMSYINAASLEIVEKLALPTRPLQHPYLLGLGDNELTITHQPKIQFQLGKLYYEVWCDLIPLHMASCHLMLGIPWTKEQGAVYYMNM
jgi:hypothetical protein